MLDHAFLAAVEALRASCEDAMLDSQVGDERFQADLLGGDLTWEVSYALPGEGRPPRVRADLTVDWPTWSQTAYRSWRLDGELADPPELGLEVVLRVQHLAAAPDVEAIRAVLEEEGPLVGADRLRRMAPMVEQTFGEDLGAAGWAVEFAYDASCELTEAMLGDSETARGLFEGFGAWLASVLVRLGDLRLAFRPPEDVEDS
jgi:hypothetical protein